MKSFFHIDFRKETKMKIIKKPNIFQELHGCEVCGCEFEIRCEDVHIVKCTTKYKDKVNKYFFTCPCCGSFYRAW